MYQILKNDPLQIRRTDGNIVTIFGEHNSEYQEYLEWLAQGNNPQPPDPPQPPVEKPPSIEERTEALELLVDYLLEAPTA